MFDPSEVIYNGKRLWICRHCRTDYLQGSPWTERLNPLRYEIGWRTDPSRGPRWKFNSGGRLALRWANLVYRIRKARKAKP